MKRIGYLHDKVYDIENIEKADDKARKHKSVRWGILKHDKNKQEENEKLSEQLKDLVYETSEYSTFKIYEPKERLIFRLPYYPDRITHHAIMNVMEPIWTKIFIKHTYSCIKDRGIHNVAYDLRLKPNYQIFPVDDRGIDFVGYRFYHTHVLLRKSIKIRLFRLVKKYQSGKIDRQELRRRMQSYFGWLKFCNSKNLLRKIQRETGLRFSNWDGKKSNISRFYNKYIHVVDMVSYSKCFRVNFVYNNKSYYFESKSRELFYSLTRYSFLVNFKIRPYVRTKKSRNECTA